jgi:integrase
VITFVITDMASITKHPRSSYYSARFTDALGHRVCRSTKQTHHKKALAVAEAWEKAAAAARGHELTQAASTKILGELMEVTMGETLNRQTIADTLNGHLDAARAGLAQQSTADRYKPVVTGFLAHLGKDRAAASVASLTPAEIEAWHRAEVAAGKSASTADYGLKVISAALARAKRLGLLLHNPAEAVRTFGHASEARQPFTDAEVAALLAVASDEWRGMILLAAWCGLRLADAAGLTWASVDLTSKTLSFRPSKTRHRDGQPLVVTLNPELVAALEALPRGIGAAPLFESLHGRKPGSHGGLSNEFARLMVRAGVAVEKGEAKEGKGRQTRTKSFHCLRHTMISRMANAEVSADVRKAIAGHSTDTAHRRYTHLSLEAQRQAVEKLPAFAVVQ